jgi:hypothetical protein
MAYRDNWLRHLIAPLTGEGLSDTLARDFWHVDEDLWSIEHDVRWRWLKLVWVYSASVVAQLTFASVIGYLAIGLVKPIDSATWWVGVGGVTAALMLFAVLVASFVWIDVSRRRGGPPAG